MLPYGAGRLHSLRWGNEGLRFWEDDPFTSFTSDTFPMSGCRSSHHFQPLQCKPLVLFILGTGENRRGRSSIHRASLLQFFMYGPFAVS